MLIEALERRQLFSVVTLNGRLVEGLDRGVVAVNQGEGNVYVGWRLLATDPDDATFNLYRSTAGAAPVKVNAQALAQTTDFVNAGVNVAQSNAYFVRPVIDGVEQVEASPKTFTLPAGAPTRQFLSIPLQIPPGGTTPTGQAYTYSANDTSVADLDGDGDYEFVVKWDPSNSKDNSQEGYTGNVYVDAYTLEGTRMWRIDLGRNIRAGAHYTQVMAYDLDSDGKAEVAMKTADGTRDGAGTVIGSATADYRNSAGRVLSGPEFLTIFNGQTGAAMATTNYLPARGTVSSWGDSYGNRVDRFLAGIAYLDGVRPSLVMTRGYYTRSVLVAWDWRGGQLTRRWTFDSNSSTNAGTAGQGNHSLSVADVDQDGRDEIVFGAMTVDHDGRLLYNTRLGHGDALHVSDMDPDRPGLEVFKVNESPSQYGDNAAAMWDARTGEILFGVPGTGDIGRGVAFDVDPRTRGYESWSTANNNLYDVDGNVISTSRPSKVNFGVWWDADPLREMLDGETIDKWNWSTNSLSRQLTAYTEPAGADAINGTKSNPNLSGDILGDWREEVVWRRHDSTALQIFTTTIPATSRLDTLAHDPVYRLSLAWQNVAYNQPPHTGFYLGAGMTTRPAAPGGLTIPARSANALVLSWTASAGAAGYNVKRATSAAGPYVTVATGLTNTTFTDPGLASGASYHYLVTATNAAGGSLNSNAAAGTTLAARPVKSLPVLPPPGPPERWRPPVRRSFFEDRPLPDMTGREHPFQRVAAQTLR